MPSFTAFAVTRLLREHFGDYVDIGFTAEIEEILDKISNGEKTGSTSSRSSTAVTAGTTASSTWWRTRASRSATR